MRPSPADLDVEQKSRQAKLAALDAMVPIEPSRPLMYLLVSLQGLPNFIIRTGLPSWLPFVCQDLGLTEAQRGILLAAWFPGYVSSQIPAAWLMQSFGTKQMLGLNMVGVSSVYLVLPLVVSLSTNSAAQVRLLATFLTLGGILQGPLMAGQKEMHRCWLPQIGSLRRPVHVKLLSLGNQLGQLIGQSATPWISHHFGWRANNIVMGGAGLLAALAWFRYAESEPTRFVPRHRDGGVGTQPHQPVSNTRHFVSNNKKKKRRGKTNWSIFTYPAVLAPVWCKMSQGNIQYTTLQFTPIYVRLDTHFRTVHTVHNALLLSG